MTYTKGPWEVVKEDTHNDNFEDSIYSDGFKGLLIARCNQNNSHKGDSNLIAAAPDLLEALEALVNDLEYVGDGMFKTRTQGHVFKAQSAIKKASGK